MVIKLKLRNYRFMHILCVIIQRLTQGFVLQLFTLGLCQRMLDFPTLILVLNLNRDKQKCDFWACADSEGPDQTALPRSLIWAFAIRCQNHWIV